MRTMRTGPSSSGPKSPGVGSGEAVGLEERLGDGLGVLLVDVGLLEEAGDRLGRRFAETALSASLTWSALSARTSGTMFCDPKFFFVSSSATKPLAAMDGSVE